MHHDDERTLEPDWKRGISKPHQTVNCPQCAGATHRRGRHLHSDQLAFRIRKMRALERSHDA
jgi:hypothetical protein